MAKTAARSVRNDKKEFASIFDSLTYNHNRWETWTDFVTMAAICISNRVDKSNFEDREKTYRQVASKYKRGELEKFADLFAAFVHGMDTNPNQDFLGEVFMALELGNSNAGQFFTPYDVCRMMVDVTMDPDIPDKIARHGWVSISDPSCGAGATLVAAANKLRDMGINYQTAVLFVAQDVDYIVGMMCYLQLSVLGCAGYVVIDDTLAHPSTSYDKRGLMPKRSSRVWYTPCYFLQEWHYRRLIVQIGVLTRPVKARNPQPDADLPTPAATEQMSLFQEVNNGNQFGDSID